MNDIKIENVHTLKDGRELFTSHNGFRKYVKSQKGEIVQVTDEYYLKSIRLSNKK